jgi:hypothetical protein
MGWLTILTEIIGGAAVLLGALVPLASIPMAAVLLVAIFTVHLPYGFSSIKLLAVTAAGAQFGPPGFETDLLYLACLAALVLGGPGPLAIDGLLAKAQRNASAARVTTGLQDCASIFEQLGRAAYRARAIGTIDASGAAPAMLRCWPLCRNETDARQRRCDDGAQRSNRHAGARQ